MHNSCRSSRISHARFHSWLLRRVENINTLEACFYLSHSTKVCRLAGSSLILVCIHLCLHDISAPNIPALMSYSLSCRGARTRVQCVLKRSTSLEPHHRKNYLNKDLRRGDLGMARTCLATHLSEIRPRLYAKFEAFCSR